MAPLASALLLGEVWDESCVLLFGTHVVAKQKLSCSVAERAALASFPRPGRQGPCASAHLRASVRKMLAARADEKFLFIDP